jgi:hypothetical protein
MDSPQRERLTALGRRYLLDAVVWALGAAGVSFLMNMGDPVDLLLSGCLGAAVMGVSAHTAIFVLQRSVHLWLPKSSRLATLSPRLVSATTFAVGGIAGFFLGGEVAKALLPGFTTMPPVGAGRFLLFLAVFSVGIFLLMYGYETLRKRLEESVERIKDQEFAEKELELARSIQERLLPETELREEGFEVAARNEAATYVAGDYFDIFRLRNGDLGLVVADVAGKGIGTSLIMASAKAMLPFIADEGTVAETLSILNRRLYRDLGRREFVALCYVRFSVAERRVEIANAGLPDPYRLTGAGRVEPLEVDGERLPLGVREQVDYSSRQWTLDPGDRLLLFSDGLAEAPAADGEPLGYERLAALLSPSHGSPADWLSALFADLRRETSPDLEDDWTAVLLEVLEVEPSKTATDER